jgi:DNA mismatch repair protein MutL
MGHIVTLDQNMINMIAAGEVIERPASVVKELMENSIDSGATRITVSVEDGGRKLISVADNGCGMDCDDLANAFEPHATSKIKTSSDLLGISTLGFRGEALASIASVAQVRAISRSKDSLEANCIEIDCGSRVDFGPCSGDYGTTMQVRDLFYKLPARRKFLRTANTEMSHINETFIRIALANVQLDMTLIHNGRELHRLPPEQTFKQRITELFSSDVARNLIETESSDKRMRILAWLGKPAISRTNNKMQYVFLNGRFIRDKFISHAIKEAYRGSLEANRYPVVFLFIEMPFEDYDVNVHPTKIEVRFDNANLVHSQVLASLREKLLGTNLDIDAKLPAPDNSRREISDAMADFFKKHRGSNTQRQFGFRPAGGSGTAIAEREYRSGPAGEIKEVNVDFLEHRKNLQIHNSFIVTQTEDGFIIIDQHALHERIMYEDLKRRIQNNKLESQKLLIPESFEVTDTQADAINTHQELINQLGIELSPFGPKTMAIQAFPTLLAKAQPVDFIGDLLDLLTNKDAPLDSERLLDEVLNMAACKAAIKAGQKLSDSEIEQLLEKKEVTESSSRCPHGRPTTITFSISDLEKQFKRT